jgi:acylphosphatase
VEVGALNSEDRKRAHAYVSGRVQGVFFRDSAREEAHRLRLAGWVRNLPDGRVEALFEGPPEAVDRMVEWCREGPRHAEVEEVEVAYEAPRGDLRAFEVR